MAEGSNFAASITRSLVSGMSNYLIWMLCIEAEITTMRAFLKRAFQISNGCYNNTGSRHAHGPRQLEDLGGGFLKRETRRGLENPTYLCSIDLLRKMIPCERLFLHTELLIDENEQRITVGLRYEDINNLNRKFICKGSFSATPLLYRSPRRPHFPQRHAFFHATSGFAVVCSFPSNVATSAPFIHC